MNPCQQLLASYGTAAASPPTLITATIGTDGTTWTFVFDQSVSIGAGGNSGWAVTMITAGAITLTYSSGGGSTTLVYTGGTTVNSGDTVSVGLNYTQPGNGIEATTGGADVVTFTSHAVINNSTQGSSTPTVSNDAHAADADVAVTTGITTTTGRNLYVFCATDQSATSVTITDTYSNTWTKVSGTITSSWIYKCENATGGAGHVFTATPNTTNLFPAIHVIEVTGAATSSSVELYNESIDSSSPFQDSITTSSNNRLLLNFIGTRDTVGATTISYSASGWTKINEETDWDIMASALFKADGSTAGTFNASFTEAGSQTLEAGLSIFAVHT